MVSLRDTAISLHILQPPQGGGGEWRVFWVKSNLKSGKKIRVFNFLRGECILCKVKFGI